MSNILLTVGGVAMALAALILYRRRLPAVDAFYPVPSRSGQRDLIRQHAASLLGLPASAPVPSAWLVLFTRPNCPNCAELEDSIRVFHARAPDVAIAVRMVDAVQYPGDSSLAVSAAPCPTPSTLASEALAALARQRAGAPCAQSNTAAAMAMAATIGLAGSPALVTPGGVLGPGATVDAIQMNAGGQRDRRLVGSRP